MVVIDRFTGDQGWLSNSAAGQVFIGGKVYPTREHAFQVAKTLDLDQRARSPGPPPPRTRTVSAKPSPCGPDGMTMSATR